MPEEEKKKRDDKQEVSHSHSKAMRGRKKKEVVKEEVSEVFEIEKNGQEKIVETHTIEKIEEKPVSETQLKKENKVFRTIIITMAGFLLMFLAVYLIIISMGKFEVDGVKFKMIKEGKLIYYNTKIPLYDKNGQYQADYNFYLTTDPRTLKDKVSLDGDLIFRKNIVLDVTTQDLFCEGDWNYFQLQLMKLNVFGINLSAKNESIKYQSLGNYTFMTINTGNQTSINQVNATAYNINVNNCEIAAVADKIMLETFRRYQEVN